MTRLKFSNYKKSIVKALTKKSKLLDIEEPLTLIDGFINEPIYSKYPNSSYCLTLPMIVCLGNKTGRLYFFALKKLLPNIKI